MMIRILASISNGLMLSDKLPHGEIHASLPDDIERHGQLELVLFATDPCPTQQDIQRRALMRSADRARKRNKKYFIMFDSLSSAALNQPSESPRVGMVEGLMMATACVLMLDEPLPGAYETRAVLSGVHETIMAAGYASRA
ncbi:hypothetical protein GCM10027277_52030 [Pseudoduganella ginsengisoli]|uniref:Uncharacterized protein n=1 Tax=Pseudoduganella ginsengisoli TaxID=1462440 RepID=A0A6L6Q586_9BURK|nr:hypothetical protein [Pseudoduganella ginsengisoli]MTW04421.1 hypothetical protein [Pseudoduganella ginsengisoli]